MVAYCRGLRDEMIFAGFSSLLRPKPLFGPIADEADFLKFICTKIKRAYPGFLVCADVDGRFCASVQTHEDSAPCLTGDLGAVFARYRQAETELARQGVIEQFLSAIGTSVFNTDVPINPDTFVFQICHEGGVRPERGEIVLPFLGELVCVLKQAGEGTGRTVTQANLDALGLSYEQAFARAVEKTSLLRARIQHDFEEDWPGLVFFRGKDGLPSGLLYLDIKGANNLPDGAYLICGDAGYVYTSARDEVNMATLLMYQKYVKHDAGGPESESLLIRQKGTWHVRRLTARAQAA